MSNHSLEKSYQFTLRFFYGGNSCAPLLAFLGAPPCFLPTTRCCRGEGHAGSLAGEGVSLWGGRRSTDGLEPSFYLCQMGIMTQPHPSRVCCETGTVVPKRVVPRIVDETVSPAAVWTWMTRAAPPSREPGWLGPQDVPLVALHSPTGCWAVTAVGRGPPTYVPSHSLFHCGTSCHFPLQQVTEDLLRN